MKEGSDARCVRSTIAILRLQRMRKASDRWPIHSFFCTTEMNARALRHTDIGIVTLDLIGA